MGYAIYLSPEGITLRAHSVAPPSMGEVETQPIEETGGGASLQRTRLSAYSLINRELSGNFRQKRGYRL